MPVASSASPAVRLVVLASLALGLASAAIPWRVAQAETPVPPPPAQWVTDRAGFLSPAVAGELNTRLGDYDRKTGHQVLVYIDHTTGGVPIEDWAVKAFERWRVGRAGMDDGAVLFIFSDDHRLRIEVGYGLEALLPDARASRIIAELMVPRIRAGDRDLAVRSGVAAILETILPTGGGGSAQQVTADVPAARPISWVKLVLGIIVAVLLLGFVVTHPGLAWLMLLSIGSGRGGGGGGGGGGWGGGGGFSGGGGRSGGGGASGSW